MFEVNDITLFQETSIRPSNYPIFWCAITAINDAFSTHPSISMLKVNDITQFHGISVMASYHPVFWCAITAINYAQEVY